MRWFVFTFTSFERPTSFLVRAEDRSQALVKLVGSLGKKRGFSDDIRDYRNDIRDGNLEVTSPKEV